jgi:uncharacterized protein (TIGR00725 family)
MAEEENTVSVINTLRRPIIGVIGASSATNEAQEVARNLGSAVLREGWHLLCGGGGGIMEAACQGFLQARDQNKDCGMTIGLLPSDEESSANRFVEIAIPTGMGWARNAIIARTAWALVAIGGCSGTLSEIAFAWQMGRPIVALAKTGGWSSKLAGQAIDDRREDTVFAAESVIEAVEYLKEEIAKR